MLRGFLATFDRFQIMNKLPGVPFIFGRPVEYIAEPPIDWHICVKSAPLCPQWLKCCTVPF